MNNKFSVSNCLTEFINMNQNTSIFGSYLLRFGKVREKSFDFNGPLDKQGEYFTLYAHEDGYRIRKTYHTILGTRYQYPMFRNSRTNEWLAFETPEEAFNRFEKYIMKKVCTKHIYGKF